MLGKADKAKKPQDSPEVKVHKLEIEKLELEEKLKKEKSEKTAMTVSLVVMLFLGAVVLLQFL